MPNLDVQYNILLRKIVSGGQTGVDRAALDAALSFGFPIGGWCPKGRLAEDGLIPKEYPMQCTPSESYNQRTAWNVRDSDGTLILSYGTILSGGTAFTRQVAENLKKPNLLIDLHAACDPVRFRTWLSTNRIKILNVAGPRESTSPGIYQKSYTVLSHLWSI